MIIKTNLFDIVPKCSSPKNAWKHENDRNSQHSSLKNEDSDSRDKKSAVAELESFNDFKNSNLLSKRKMTQSLKEEELKAKKYVKNQKKKGKTRHLSLLDIQKDKYVSENDGKSLLLRKKPKDELVAFDQFIKKDQNEEIGFINNNPLNVKNKSSFCRKLQIKKPGFRLDSDNSTHEDSKEDEYGKEIKEEMDMLKSDLLEPNEWKKMNEMEKRINNFLEEEKVIFHMVDKREEYNRIIRGKIIIPDAQKLSPMLLRRKQKGMTNACMDGLRITHHFDSSDNMMQLMSPMNKIHTI